VSCVRHFVMCQATKKLWQILKSEERGLQKNNKGAYVLDEELASVFKRKTLNFKTISKVLWCAGVPGVCLNVLSGCATAGSHAPSRCGLTAPGLESASV